MTLLSAADVARFDRDGADIRSRWLDGTLTNADSTRLWGRLGDGVDLGASAILRDIGQEKSPSTEQVLAPSTRVAISAASASAQTYHHRGPQNFELAAAPDSVHWIEAGSIAIPCRVRRAKSSVLVVAFHGVLQRSKYQLPRFEWLNSLRPLGLNVMSFGDPTMDLVPTLEGGWWLGTALTDLMPIVAGCVRKIRHDLDAEHIIFAGSSMGGYGALQLGGFFADSTVLAFNPQTDVRRYHAKRVTRAAMGAVFGTDLEPDPVRTNVIARYASTDIAPSRIRYVTNTGDRHHIEDHFDPFVTALASNASTSFEHSTRNDGDGHVKIPADAFVAMVGDEVDRLVS